MPTRYFRADPQLGSIGTTRYLTITTAAAQQVIMGSGNQGLFIYNIGSGNLIWGDSSIAVNSGNYIFVNGGREWLNARDQFGIFFRADSVATLISITEYSV